MEEKPKRQPGSARQNAPCLLCDGTDFMWGLTVGDHPRGRLYVRSDGAGWGEGVELRARICNGCGNVQLFVKG
jgi:hypothetical protein